MINRLQELLKQFKKGEYAKKASYLAWCIGKQRTLAVLITAHTIGEVLGKLALQK